MPSPSPESGGPPGPQPQAHPPTFEELYWDIDSGVVADPEALPENPGPRPASIPTGSNPPAADPFSDPQSLPEAEPLSSPPGGQPWDKSRSLRKPRAEPLSFPPPGSKETSTTARQAESAPLSPIEMAPRAHRADASPEPGGERDETAHAPAKMPLQRKSGEGVEMFTRLTTRPQSATDAAALPLMALPNPAADGDGGGGGFGKLKENSVPVYQASRLQEVIDHTYTQTAHRRMGRRRGAKGRMGKIFFAFAFASLGGILIWTWTHPKPDPQALPTAGPSVSAPSATPVPPPVKSPLPDPATLPALTQRHSTIRNGLTALIQASTLEEKLPWVLHAERLSGRMKDFYLAQKGQDPSVTAIEVSQPIPGPDAWWFLISLATTDGPPIRIAARETPQGPRFDWENLVAYGSMPYTLFRSEKPAIPQSFRLNVRASTVFAGKYTETGYAACDVAPRTGEPVLHAYAQLGTPAANQIARLTAKPGWNAALLSLHWETDAGAPDAVAIEQAAKISLPGEEVEKNDGSSNEKAEPTVPTASGTPAGAATQ